MLTSLFELYRRVRANLRRVSGQFFRQTTLRPQTASYPTSYEGIVSTVDEIPVGRLETFLRAGSSAERPRRIAVFNRWRRMRRALYGSHHLAIDGCDLTNSDLEHLDLSYCSLTYAKLSGCNLYRANLSNCNLYHASLSSCNLNRARLTDSNLDDAQLVDSDLDGATLVDASLKGAQLTRSRLADACLWSADLSNANLQGVDATGADMTRASLDDAHFSGAILERVILRKASLKRCVLSHAKGASKANLADADLTRAELIEADLAGAILDYANLSGVRARDAHFEEAYLRKAVLHGANVENAHFDGCNLEGCDLSRAVARGVYLTDADLTNADLSNTYLESARLQRAVFRNARLEETFLGGAELEGVDWEHARFDSVQLSLGQLGRPLKSERKFRWSAAEDVYRRLKGNFEEVGNYRDANKAYVAERMCRARSHAPRWLRKWWPAYWRTHSGDGTSQVLGILPLYWEEDPRLEDCRPSFIRWAWDFIPRYLCKYGTSLKWAIFWLLGLIALMSWVYWYNGLLYDQDTCLICDTPSANLDEDTVEVAVTVEECRPAREQCPAVTSYLTYLKFSLASAVTMNLESIAPRTSLAEFFVGVEALLAIALAGLVGFVLGNWLRYS